MQYAGRFGTLINNNGGFFRDVNGTNGVNPGMSFVIQGGGPAARQFILLHELGHALGASGFQDDFKDRDAQKANNELLEQNCLKTLGR